MWVNSRINAKISQDIHVEYRSASKQKPEVVSMRMVLARNTPPAVVSKRLESKRKGMPGEYRCLPKPSDAKH
jgi:hypothetical protein